MLYIAYGSNLNLEQMTQRCPDALPITTATIPKTRLIFRGSGSGFYLSIEPQRPKQPRSVPCVIWDISEEDEQRLDRYEGFPSFYHKHWYCLTGDDHKRYRAMAYVLSKDHPLGMPDRFYWDVCVEGYEDFELPLDALRTALRDTAGIE
jgi:hypothetical protein